MEDFLKIFDIAPHMLCDEHLWDQDEVFHIVWSILTCEKVKTKTGQFIRRYCKNQYMGYDCGEEQFDGQPESTCRSCKHDLRENFTHPEVERWRLKEGDLFFKHFEVQMEIEDRGFVHDDWEMKVLGKSINILENPSQADPRFKTKDQMKYLAKQNCDCIQGVKTYA